MAPARLQPLTQSALFTDVPYFLPIAIVVFSILGALCVGLSIAGYIYWRRNRSSGTPRGAPSQVYTVKPQLTITDTTTLPASTKIVGGEKDLDDVIRSSSSRILDLHVFREAMETPRRSSSLSWSREPSSPSILLSSPKTDPNLLGVPFMSMVDKTPRSSDTVASLGIWWHDFHLDHSDVESLSSDNDQLSILNTNTDRCVWSSNL